MYLTGVPNRPCHDRHATLSIYSEYLNSFGSLDYLCLPGLQELPIGLQKLSQITIEGSLFPDYKRPPGLQGPSLDYKTYPQTTRNSHFGLQVSPRLLGSPKLQR